MQVNYICYDISNMQIVWEMCFGEVGVYYSPEYKYKHTPCVLSASGWPDLENIDVLMSRKNYGCVIYYEFLKDGKWEKRLGAKLADHKMRTFLNVDNYDCMRICLTIEEK